MTREEALDTMGATLDDWIDKKNMHMIIDKIYVEHEAQMKAKNEEIERLNCRAYHAEGYINDLHNHPKDKKFYDAKARSIVAMLFWEARKTLTEYRNTEHCDALYNYYYGQKQQFIEAYAMLKETR